MSSSSSLSPSSSFVMDRNLCLRQLPAAERASRLAAEYARHRAYIEQHTLHYTRDQGVRNVIDYWYAILPLHSHRPFCRYVQASSSYTYAQAERLSNQLAHFFLSQRVLSPAYFDPVHRRYTVALLMENCPFFILTWMALAKLGCTVALINSSLHGAQLRQAVHTASARVIIVSKRCQANWKTAEEVMVTEDRQRLLVLYSLGQDREAMEDASSATTATAPPSTSTSMVSSASSPSISSVDSPSASYRSHLASAEELRAVESDDEAEYYDDKEQLAAFSEQSPPSSLRSALHLDDPLFYIQTSGTTGPSKAAYFSHRRFIGAGVTWSYPMQLTSADVYYVVLPLFHGNGGVVAVSACWHVGCQLLLREKLSVRSFWPDVRRYGVTAMIYVGEVWRYLHSAARKDDDAINSLRVIAGNGLRPDIWEDVVQRFGIQLVVEHFGCTEMPAGPYIQWMGQPGACGFIPPSINAAQGADKLIEYDVQRGAVVRRPPTPSSTAAGLSGHCVEVPTGSTGECIFKLAPGLTEEQVADNPHMPSDALARSKDVNPAYKPYHGYTDDAASLQRVYRHVFSPYDAWFSTGDLLRRDAEGFIYFVDRMGDSFRWKGENVATSSVQEVLAAAPQVQQANVYGVHYPGRDGKAGMAQLRLQAGCGEDDVDFHALFLHCYQHLPPFAIPIFLRLTQVIAETSTSKYSKYLAVKEGFDPACVSEPLYTLDAKSCTYRRLTPALFEQVLDAGYRGYEVAR